MAKLQPVTSSSWQTFAIVSEVWATGYSRYIQAGLILSSLQPKATGSENTGQLDTCQEEYDKII